MVTFVRLASLTIARVETGAKGPVLVKAASLASASFTVRLEAMARFREFIGDFTAVKSGGEKFLMIDAYQLTKPFIQA